MTDYADMMLFMSTLLRLCPPARFRCRACRRFMARRSHSFLVAETARPSIPLDAVLAATHAVESPLALVRWCATCTLSLAGVTQAFSMTSRFADAAVSDEIPF